MNGRSGWAWPSLSGGRASFPLPFYHAAGLRDRKAGANARACWLSGLVSKNDNDDSFFKEIELS